MSHIRTIKSPVTADQQVTPESIDQLSTGWSFLLHLWISGSPTWAPYIECPIWEWWCPVTPCAEVSSVLWEAKSRFTEGRRGRGRRGEARGRRDIYISQAPGSTAGAFLGVLSLFTPSFLKRQWRHLSMTIIWKKLKSQRWRKIPNLDVPKSLSRSSTAMILMCCGICQKVFSQIST